LNASREVVQHSKAPELSGAFFYVPNMLDNLGDPVVPHLTLAVNDPKEHLFLYERLCPLPVLH
jgi:hypothetical protein